MGASHLSCIFGNFWCADCKGVLYVVMCRISVVTYSIDNNTWKKIGDKLPPKFKLHGTQSKYPTTTSTLPSLLVIALPCKVLHPTSLHTHDMIFCSTSLNRALKVGTNVVCLKYIIYRIL